MTRTSLHDDLYTAALRQMRRERPRPTLSDRDLAEIEYQIDDDTPVYVPTLIRELRDARAALALLSEGLR